MNNDDFLYLIANPDKKKKTYVFENTDNELLILLQKKFKKNKIIEDNFTDICISIQNKIDDLELKLFVKKIVDNIFENILSEHV
tara:strand:+ start:134 stop:385 length:252 start_codon:yes stop_codon:yes gene_type:complete